MQKNSTPVLAKPIRACRLTFSSLVFLMFFFCSFPGLSAEWVYTVKAGDNLWDLSEDFLINIKYWRRLQAMNNVKEPMQMPLGKTLRIPLAWTKIHPADAKVSEFSGRVRIIRKGKEHPVSSGMLLLAGDEVFTEADASIILIFGDDSQLVLREESRLKLDKMEYYGNKGVFNTQLNLKSGRTDNKINPDKKPDSRFEIHTPSATAAVRGTSYRVAVLGDTITSTEVLTGRVAVANVKGQTDVDSGYGVVARLSTAPTPPIALLQAPDLAELPELVEQLPVRFNLPVIDKADSYRVLVSQDPTFNSVFLDGVATTAVANLKGIPDGNYLIKVRGIDKHSLEGKDGVHSFTVNAKPEAPFLVKPRSKAAVPLEYKEFSWAKNKNISNYHFQLADNEKFNRPVIDEIHEDKGNAYEIDKPLAPGKWFWRVAAIDIDEGPGPFGETATFRVMRAGPLAEEPIVSETGITFRWAEGFPGDKYRIQIAHNEIFEDPVVDQQTTVPEFSIASPAAPTIIYMRSKLIDADGLEASWSTTQSLEIAGETPYWLGVIPFLFIL